MRWSDEVEQLRVLLGRAAYLERLDEQHGPDRNRAREICAIRWIVGELVNVAPSYAADVEEAGQMLAAQQARAREQR